ncbi:MAG: hypothetical protein ACFCUG_13725 [Thiotrichales bacterium]
MIHNSDPPPRVRPAALRFILIFAALVALGFSAIAAAHWVLARGDLLPPPPLVANPCIDSKLAFLARTELDKAAIVAVGSSTTWRNLDMRVFERRLGKAALNAAPCYLHIDQTAVLAEFLVTRLPALETLLVVVHPRDFDTCHPGEREFFNPWLLGAYLDGWIPQWWPYITGLRPFYLVKHVLAQRKSQRDGGIPLVADGLGSEALAATNGWNPELILDEQCFEGVERLAALAQENTFELVLVLLPHEAQWRNEHDPTGARLDAWATRLTAMAGASVRVVDTRDLAWARERFADPVHLLAPYVAPYSEIVAARLLARDAAAR